MMLFRKSIPYVHRMAHITKPWADKLFVNYLKVTKFMRIHGPTADEVTEGMDLSDKTCLITGGTSGIGSEMIRCLLSRKCNVVMACRNPYAASVASKMKWGKSDNLTVYKVNLTSLKSVKELADSILKDQKILDIVIFNAAVFGLPWTVTEDGLETTFQVNYLSQYYLLLHIQKILAPDARIVFISSDSHRNLVWSQRQMISPTPDILSLPKETYTSIRAYNVSKLCGILTMHNLSYRWLHDSKSVFCAHPGSFIKTNLDMNWWIYELLYSILYPFTKSIAQAAATPLYCATSPNLRGFTDMYFKNCKHADESELAKSNHLSFRITEIARNMLNERVPMPVDDFLQGVKLINIGEAKEEGSAHSEPLRLGPRNPESEEQDARRIMSA